MYEYFDEDGNPIDPDQLGSDYEIVEEIEVDDEVAVPTPAPQGSAVGAQAPASPAPATPPASRAPKGLIAGGVALVLLIGGGAAYAMNALGQQNTVADAKEQVVEARESVDVKKEEITHPPVDACSDLSKAKWSGSSAPRMQLRVTQSEPLPAGFVDHMDAASGKYWVAQTGRDSWTVSVKQPRTGMGLAPDAPWWVVEADVAEGAMTMSEGLDAAAGKDISGACVPRISTAGAYQVAGEVPAGAEGLRDGQVSIHAIQASGSSETGVVGVLGDTLAVMELEYVPEPAEEQEQK